MMATHFPPAGRLGRLLSLFSLSLALAGCLPQPPAAVQAELSLVADQGIQLDWVGVSRASHYRVLENVDGESGFNPLGDDLPGQGLADQPLSYRLDAAPLHRRLNAQYLVQSCNSAGCTDGPAVSVSGNLATAVSYLKASNSDKQDLFGYALALSADGRTLAVGAPHEASLDDPEWDAGAGVGAVYLFQRSAAGRWQQQDMLKPGQVPDAGLASFGYALSLNAAGTLLAVGQPNLGALGRVQLYRRVGSQWMAAQTLTASQSGTPTALDMQDMFGAAVSLNAAGTALAVAAPGEWSAAGFPDTTPGDNSLRDAGAAYLFVADDGAPNGWCECGFIKAPTPREYARFGSALSLVGDTELTLAVGDGLPQFPSPPDDGFTGQVHLYRYQPDSDTPLRHQQSLAGSDAGERFGAAVQLSPGGQLLAIGAPRYSRDWVYAISPEASKAYSGDPNAGPGRVQLFQYNDNSSEEPWQSLQHLNGSDSADGFGQALTFSPGGDWLAVGAFGDDHANSRGVMTGPGNSAASPGNNSGAVFLFQRDGDDWRLANYLKAPNPDSDDWFGDALALSADGQLAVAASGENSDARGVGGDASSNREYDSGAVYVY